MNMLRNATSILVFGGLIALTASQTRGQTCESADKRFIEFEDERWHNDINWDPFGYPGSENFPGPTTSACIPEGKHCSVVGPGVPDVAECEFLVLEGERGLGIDIGKTLIIHDDSRIDGQLTMIGTLQIASDLTIRGNGGFIFGNHVTCPSIVPSNYTLKLLGENNANQETSITLDGPFQVYVRLENDGYVVSRLNPCEPPRPLTLFEEVSGNGHWKATGQVGAPHGEILFKKPITGGADFLISGHPEAKITIASGAASVDLTGAFTMTDGVFVVNDNFKTTGTFLMQSVNDSAPKIEVAAHKTLDFEKPAP